MSKSQNVKPRQAKNKKMMLVRYGRMGLLGWFEHHQSELPKVNTRVMVKTDRGLELGEVVGPYCYRSGQFRMSPKEVQDYYNGDPKNRAISSGGTFVRHATEQDVSDERRLAKSAIEEKKCCQRFASELNLDMKVVDAEHIFGGERIVFYFIADGRVDFRELVRKLAREYQTRIEMRQIGSRDQAKLVADYETCGLECCCRRFLRILKPVNMKMAKLQKATLDPAKISGHCGRLKCCLRYEDETYRDLKKRLPRKNSLVNTEHGRGKVIDTQILTQLVVVQTGDGNQFAVPLEEVQIISGAESKNTDSKQSNTDNRNNRSSNDKAAKPAQDNAGKNNSRQDAQNADNDS